MATKLTVEGGGNSPIEQDYTSDHLNDWVPGDWGYITNTKFSNKPDDIGLEGENIIYVGKDLFWGHFNPGLEYKTLAEWFNMVQSWNSGAEHDDSRRYPTAGLE
jgi:hypothetical protein